MQHMQFIHETYTRGPFRLSTGEVIGWIDNSTLFDAWPVDSAFSGWKLAEIFQEKTLFNGDLAKLIWSEQKEHIP